MAKRLNKNLVIGLAAVGFVLMTAAGIVMVYQLQQTDPREFVKRAEGYAKEKEWNQAKVFYMRAYSASQDPVYLVRAGDMMAADGKERDALQAYGNAVLLDPSLLEAHEKTLDLQLEIARMYPSSPENWRNVHATAEKILELAGDKPHPKAVYAEGASLIGLKDVEEGSAAEGLPLLEKAVEMAPDDVDYARDLADQYIRQGREKDAVALFEKLLANNESPGRTAAMARVYFARYLMTQKELDRADEVLEKGVSLAGDDPEVQAEAFVEAARYWMLRSQAAARGEAAEGEQPSDQAVAKAESLLKRSIDADPDGFDSYLLLTELYRRQDAMDKAIEIAEARLKRPIRREGLAALRSRWRRYQLLLIESEMRLAQAMKEPDGSDRREALTKKADMCVADALGEFPNGAQAYYERGKIRLAEGKVLEAIKVLEHADELSTGDDWRTLYYLAQARLQVGEVGAASEAIKRAVALPGAPAAVWLAYARILLRTDDARGAIIAADQVLAQSPDNPDAMLVKAAAQDKLGQASQANETFHKIETASPPVVAAQARSLASSGDYEKAISLVSGALKDDPTNVALVTAAAVIYKDHGDDEPAQRVVESALAQAPDSFDLQLLKIQLSDADDDAKKQEVLKLVEDTPDDYLRAVRLASIRGQENDLEAQYDQLQRAKDLIVNRATDAARRAGEQALRAIVDRMFMAAARLGDEKKLDAVVEEAAKLNLDAADGVSYRGRKMLYDGQAASDKASKLNGVKGKEEEAKKLSESARENYERAVDAFTLALKRFPTSGETYANLGQAYIRLNRYEDAKAALEHSDDLIPGNGDVVKGLAWLASLLGDEAEFKDRLAQARTLLPDDPWIKEQSLLQEEEQKPRDGIARREEIRKERPDDTRNLFMLARLYREVHDDASAEGCIDAALAVDSSFEQVIRAARMLRSIDKPDKALKLLEDNLRNAPADQKAQAQLAIGDFYMAMDQMREAERAYLAAADIDATEQVCIAIGRFAYTVGNYPRALEWLKKAEDLARKNDSPQLAAILRGEVEALVRSGEPGKAGELAAAYREQFPEDVDGILLEAVVAVAEGRIQDALDRYTAYLDKNPSDPATLYRRAQIRASLGNWQQAIADLEQIRAIRPAALDFAPRILLARAYGQIGRDDLAQLELESLHEQHPEADNVTSELIDLYIRLKKYAEAEGVVTTLLNEDPDNVQWLVHAGRVAAERKDVPSAVQYYQKAARKSGYNPSIVKEVLSQCARRGAEQVGISFYENEIPPDRRTPEVTLAYANLLATRGDADAAMTNYRAAIQNDGMRSIDFIDQVTVAAARSLGGIDKAVEACRSLGEGDLFDRANKHLLAGLLTLQKSNAEAKQVAESLLGSAESDPEKAAVQLRLAAIAAQSGEIQSATETYKKVLEINRDDFTALNNLAYLLAENLNKPEEAVPYAKSAVSASLRLPLLQRVACLDTLGWTYARLGRYRDAIAQLTLARQLDLNYLPAAYHLGEVYRKSGQFDEAKSVLQNVASVENPDNYGEYVEKAKTALEQVQQRSSD